MDNNPEAAVTPEVQTETQPNTNSEPAQAPENTLTLTPEQMKYISANGGFEKWFTNAKSALSNPQPKAPEPTLEPKQPEPQPEPQYQLAEPAQGYITPTQIAALQYNQMLQNDTKYAGIKEYINDGTFLADMTEMGMSPVDASGNLNDFAIRKFLDLKAQTVPAVPTDTPTTSTAPTVQYVEVGENITSQEEAMAVLQQANHPRHQDAINFLATQIRK